MVTSLSVALPQGYALNEYRIESTLGIGGFGLTYLASDSNLNLKVAIKEFLPCEFALRCADQSVRPNSESSADTFKWGLTRFLDESRALAAFRHPNIVRVMRFFEANQTAYMVMEFVAGQSLTEWVRPRRPLDESNVLAMADALLDGLEVVHRANYLHRDIKPNNIFVRDDGSPVLIDFGSARLMSAGAEITSIVTPGYAPFEQYHADGNQGPWSDLYAFGAVLYWMLTGSKPADSLARVREDVMLPAAKVGDRSRYSAELLQAIDWALAPLEEARPQSVADFRNALRGITPIPVPDNATVLVAPPPAPASGASRVDISIPATLDGESLKRIETALAVHIGPIASVVVRSAAGKVNTLNQVIERVATEIANADDRRAFVKKLTAAEPATPTSLPTGATTSPAQPVSQRFDAATLAKAEAALASYIGAVARVLVKRAAGKARDESDLYLLLSEEIENPDARKAFVRKGLSVSGRP